MNPHKSELTLAWRLTKFAKPTRSGRRMVLTFSDMLRKGQHRPDGMLWIGIEPHTGGFAAVLIKFPARHRPIPCSVQ